MLAINILFLIIFSYLLVQATEILVQALNRLAKLTHLGKFALTSILLALATSLPELSFCLTAALENKSNLALGNVLGANISNISLVVGGAALFGGSIGVIGEFLKKDLIATFLAGILPLVLLSDGSLSRVEGLLLILIYGVYNYTILNGHRKKIHHHDSFGHHILRRLNHKGTDREFAWLFLGAVLLIFSADMLVKNAVIVAQQLGIPLILIGLFLISIGTTLPEFLFELKAVRKGEVGMVFGNLIGSVVALSTLIIGLTALIQPVKLDANFNEFFLATMVFVILFSILWFFTSTKRKIERWEGLILVLLYFIFVGVEFLVLR